MAANKSVARQRSSKSRAHGMAGIPDQYRPTVRALLGISQASDGDLAIRTPAQALKWIRESEQRDEQRRAEDERHRQTERRRYERESAREAAKKAIRTLAMVRDGIRALEDDTSFQPYMDEYDLALYLRLAVMNAGRALENALMVYELMPSQKDGNRHFNAGDE